MRLERDVEEWNGARKLGIGFFIAGRRGLCRGYTPLQLHVIIINSIIDIALIKIARYTYDFDFEWVEVKWKEYEKFSRNAGYNRYKNIIIIICTLLVVIIFANTSEVSGEKMKTEQTNARESVRR